jgi:hypothetical protein
MDIFTSTTYHFPYEDLKFPGQHTEEKILFVTREGKVVLYFKLTILLAISILGTIITALVLGPAEVFGFALGLFVLPTVAVWLIATTLIGLWISKVWQKTVFVITNRRLTKFIHTTPWSRYQMSLALDKIVDTGAYQKGWFQVFTGLGYFVARSAAGAVKNFKIVNIGFAEDLHNYVNKLLFIFNEKHRELDDFRPFIPHLKGEARDTYVRKVSPKYGKPPKTD